MLFQAIIIRPVDRKIFWYKFHVSKKSKYDKVC